MANDRALGSDFFCLLYPRMEVINLGNWLLPRIQNLGWNSKK